jgi:alanine racemase
MHRLGFAPNDYLNVFTQLSQHCNVKKIVLMSHFANADVLDSSHTAEQMRVFQEAIVPIPQIEMSLANSAAILAWQEAQRALYLKVACDVDQQWSRPGIMLYGANPLPNSTHLLQPVMQLRSKIIAIQTMQAGDSIGYGSLFTAQRNTKVGVVACGYADGYPRSAMHAPAAVDGVMTQVIGRVSMDMLFVDLTDLPLASIGSVVELWGEKVSVNAVAKAAGTIAYELLCNVKRVEFRYTDAATLI